ncbi:hypothetical protein DFQ26_005991 [Actinomortierella ambigua]|nr:hypothetical protein DFQ26_005991 [Actinomortierella ambigua]
MACISERDTFDINVAASYSCVGGKAIKGLELKHDTDIKSMAAICNGKPVEIPLFAIDSNTPRDIGDKILFEVRFTDAGGKTVGGLAKLYSTIARCYCIASDISS